MKRRAFLARAGAAIAGGPVFMSLPAIFTTSAVARRAREEDRPFAVLTPAEATELEAMAERIMPSGEEPGAREAGVVHFMDQALAGPRADALASIRAGLAELAARVEAADGERSFADLDPARQIAVLREIEDTSFFGSVRFLTLAGMFSDPSYGGNRDGVGWALIGFDQRPAPPPFGWYDADYVEKGA